MAEIKNIADFFAKKEGLLTEFAPGVTYFTALLANVHTIDVPGGFVLVDTGVAGSGLAIRAAIRARYGENAKPLCIVLTHGHLDHAGCVEAFVDDWGVPVYAHRLELPYLTGKSSYPPPDPTVGGAMAQFSRLFRKKPYDLGDRVAAIPESMQLSELPGWRILHTPGHTHGHISLFRESDQVLIAGDAVSTLDQASFLNVLTQARRFGPPPQYYTSDWDKAEASMRELAALRPEFILCGHGKPTAHAADEFAQFVSTYRRPEKGRYVNQAAIADETGVVQLPPAPPDPFPRYAAAAAIGLGATLFLASRNRKRAS